MKTYYKILTAFPVIGIFLFLLSNSLSAQWIQQNSGTSINLRCVYFINNMTGWAGGAGSTVLKTTNGGTIWGPQIIGASRINSIYFVNFNTGWAVGFEPGTPPGIYKTTNGGANWIGYAGSLPIDEVLSVNFVNATTGWIGTSGWFAPGGGIGMIMRTTNGGDNWIRTGYLDSLNSMRSVFFINPTTGWAATQWGHILKTTNAGDNWLIKHTLELPYTPNSAAFSDINNGIFVGDVGRVFNSHDGGENWEGRSTLFPITNINYVSMPLGLPYAWIVGENNFIKVSTNYGDTWTDQSASGGNYKGVCFPSITTGYAVGDGGVIIATTTGGYSPPAVPTNLTATAVSTSQINLNWQDNSNNEDYFGIERSTNGSSWTLIDSVSRNTVTYQSTGLIPNQDYYYRVYAKWGFAGSGYSNQTFAFTQLPVPVLLTPSNNSTNQSLNPNVSWSPVAGGLIYHLQIAYDVNFNSVVFNDSTLNVTSYNLPSGILQYGTTYYWRVRAKNLSTKSAYSSNFNFTTTSGAAGSALDFDGVNDYVSVPDLPGINNFSSTLKFSIESWCRVNTDAGDFAFINKGGGAGNEQYSLDINGSSLRFYLRDAAGAFTTISAPRITIAEGWVHIACTFDHSSGIMKLYKNGVQIGSASPPFTLNSNTNPFALGAQAAPLNAFLNGKLDDVRIWNHARSQTEIQNNMNCEIPASSSGLLANYHFNQGIAAGINSSITTLTDVSGNGNNGTLNGFAKIGFSSNFIAPGGTAPGNFCGPAAALDFDGVNDYVSVPDLPGINNFSSTLKFSIESWCRVNADAGSFVFINKGGGGGNEQYSLDIEGGSLRFYVKDAGGMFTSISAPRITVAEGWVHIACTFDHSTSIMKLYKNGVQIGSANPPFTLNSNTNSFALGAQAAPLNAFLNGKMDDVRIWNHARSQTEIQNNMNCEIPASSSGLLANYHFNQGTASGMNSAITALTDASGNGNNGTLNGFARSGITSNFVSPGGVTAGVNCAAPLSTMIIKVIPEGFYNIVTGKLNSKDTVRAYLNSNVSPYNVVDSAIAVIDSATFVGSFTFSQPAGTYYIVVKHRNSIETWSRTGGEPFIPGSAMSYDFTNAANKAFQNNMKQVNSSPLRFAIYSGDVDRNSAVDLTDIVNIYNDAAGFLTGYVITDVNGDNVADLTDILITFNNSSNFVTKKTP